MKESLGGPGGIPSLLRAAKTRSLREARVTIPSWAMRLGRDGRAAWDGVGEETRSRARPPWVAHMANRAWAGPFELAFRSCSNSRPVGPPFQVTIWRGRKLARSLRATSSAPHPGLGTLGPRRGGHSRRSSVCVPDSSRGMASCGPSLAPNRAPRQPPRWSWRRWGSTDRLRLR